METIDAPLKLFLSLWNQFTHAPSHLVALVVLLALGMMLKRSPLKNGWIPWCLTAVGVIGYPFLASATNIDPSFPRPRLVLALYGGILAVGSIVAHYFLKKLAWFRNVETALVKSYDDTEVIEKPMPPATLPLIAIALFLCGCGSVRVPANTLHFESPHGKLDITHPQDFMATNLVVSIETNGTAHASFGFVQTANSPEVIDRTARGQVEIIKAQGKAFVDAFDAGARAAGTLGGTAFKAAK